MNFSCCKNAIRNQRERERVCLKKHNESMSLFLETRNNILNSYPAERQLDNMRPITGDDPTKKQNYYY